MSQTGPIRVFSIYGQLTFSRCTTVTALSIQNKIHWFHNYFWALVFVDLVKLQFEGLVNLLSLIISRNCTVINTCIIIILDQLIKINDNW